MLSFVMKPEANRNLSTQALFPILFGNGAIEPVGAQSSANERARRGRAKN